MKEKIIQNIIKKKLKIKAKNGVKEDAIGRIGKCHCPPWGICCN